MSPTIDFAHSIELPSELQSDFSDVLQRMYPDHQRIVVEKLFSSHSFSGGWVFQIQPIKNYGQPGRALPIIVKIGSVNLIEREYQAYTTYIQGQWPAVAELRQPPISASPNGLSGLAYALEGDGVFSIQTLLDYCQDRAITNQDVRKAADRLERILSESILRGSQTRVKFSLQASYEGVLPVNFWVVPFPADYSLQQPALSICPDSLPKQPLELRTYVHLENFIVTKVDRQKQTLTLNVPDALQAETSARRSYSIRLRYANRDAMPACELGQVMPELEGLIEETRESQWQAEMDKLGLETHFDLSQLEVRLENGEPLPNPFLAVPRILEPSPDVKINNVHGDLNLGNVLVDPETQDVRLIDFADARPDHVLHDLLRLETNIVTKLLSLIFAKNNQLSAQTIYDLYKHLHPYLTSDSENESAAKVVHPDLEKSWVLLSMIRKTAREYGLFRRDHWAEYYDGLTLYLLGALKFHDLSSEAKEAAFWGAATAQKFSYPKTANELISQPPAPAPPENPDTGTESTHRKNYLLSALLIVTWLGIIPAILYMTWEPLKERFSPPSTAGGSTLPPIHSEMLTPTVTPQPIPTIVKDISPTSMSLYPFFRCPAPKQTLNTTKLVSPVHPEVIRIGHGINEELRFSPNGRYLALASGVGVWLYTLDSSCKLQLLDLPAVVQSIAWSADGTYLAAGSNDNRLRIWQVERDQFVQVEEYKSAATIEHIVWSPESDKLITIAENRLFFWDIINNPQPQEFSQLTDIEGGLIYSADWSPNGKYVAYSTDIYGLIIWNMENDKFETTLKQPRSTIQQLAWSPDSSKLASIYKIETDDIEDWEAVNQVDIWDADSWEKQSLPSINEFAPRLEWAPNSQQLAYGNPIQIRIWDLEQEGIIHSLQDDTYVLEGMTWYPNGKHLATVGHTGEIQFWDVETGEENHQIEAHFPVGPSTWSPDGKRIATGWIDGHITVWAPLTSEIVYIAPWRGNTVHGIVWSPESDRLATLHWDGLTRIWNLGEDSSPGQIDKTYKPKHDDIATVAWSQPKKRGQFVASGALNGNIYIWLVDNWDEVCVLEDDNYVPVQSVTWSLAYDEEILVSAEDDGAIRIWDIESCWDERAYRITEPKQILYEHGSDVRVTSVLWSPTEDRQFISGSSAGDVILWTQEDENWSSHLLHDKSDVTIRVLAWSSDGAQLAVGISNQIEIWDMETEHPSIELNGHNDIINTLSWSPDNQQLVSSSQDGTVRIWDVTEPE